MLQQSEAMLGWPELPGASRLDLYWIPLGAGARVVRLSGKTYEALVAVAQRRRRRKLFHSALVAMTGDARFVVEMAPIPDYFGAAATRRRGRGPGRDTMGSPLPRFPLRNTTLAGRGDSRHLLRRSEPSADH